MAYSSFLRLVALLALTPAASAQLVRIDFDDWNASCSFAASTELTTEYEDLGVTCSGPTLGTGGAVLDQCGNFGVNARSGTQFLAFNVLASSQSGTPSGPESFRFEPAASTVSLWVSGGPQAGDFLVEGYRQGQLIGSNSVQSLAGAYAELTFTGPSSVDEVVVTSLGRSDYWVFDDLTFLLGPPVNSFCWGDGVHVTCPCGNFSVAGEGCRNSTGVGAILSTTGVSELGADTLALHVEQAPANRPGLFFQGTLDVNGGAGSLFGDGLRCAGGQVTRLEVVLTDAAGLAQNSTVVSSHSVIPPGEVRYYQFWYRDPHVGPCSQGFNLSNGVTATWH